MTKVYGFTVDDIDWSSPADLEPYSKAYNLEIMQKDSLMHTMGMYNMSAVMVSIDRFIAGRKSKAEYINEPILQKSIEEQCMTQEELDERELQKMLMYEEQWASISKQNGLPIPELK